MSDDNAPKQQWPRRGVLRAAGAAGIVAATTGAVLGVPSPASATQTSWRWCKQCYCLYYSSSGHSTCSWGGLHNGTSSVTYVIKFNSDGGHGQPNWRYCFNCSTLHFSTGVCAWNDGAHITSPSGYYMIETEDNNDGTSGLALQGAWRYCANCSQLWWTGDGASLPRAACPAGGKHIKLPSYFYLLRYTT